MKTKIYFLIAISILSTNLLFSQTNTINEIYADASNLLKENKIEKAYELYKKLYSKVDSQDTLKNYITWYYIGTASELESQSRMNENFEKSLTYGLESLKLIQDNKSNFNESFAEREPWMIKNIIVSYFGLNNFDKAKEYKSILYKRYNENNLPKGIDNYFNFDFFRLGDKNIWGYEWFAELPENRFSSSFTKVIYYVYSTNPDGSDKEQLYRFHVLMFHQDPKDAKFDYILERQIETDKGMVSGSYYQYTYKEDIDYKKLRNDIIEIVTKEIEPDTRRTISKQ